MYVLDITLESGNERGFFIYDTSGKGGRDGGIGEGSEKEVFLLVGGVEEGRRKVRIGPVSINFGEHC